MNRARITFMSQVSLLAAVMLVLMITGFGYLPVGPIRATTMHIPVIIGGVLLGPLAGGILGGVFGISSVIQNTIAPTVTSFVFSPFYSLGEFSGNGWSIVIAIVPRILIGVVAAYLYQALSAGGSRWKGVSCTIAGIVASMTNTILVMSGIYLFFGESYASAKEMSYELLFSALAGIVGVNGVVEAMVAGLITLVVCRPLFKILKRR